MLLHAAVPLRVLAFLNQCFADLELSLPLDDYGTNTGAPSVSPALSRCSASFASSSGRGSGIV